MPISPTLTASLEQHLARLRSEKTLTNCEGELANSLTQIFYGDEQQSQLAAQEFCETWADFSNKHMRDAIWPLFVYGCYHLLAQAATTKLQNPDAETTTQLRLHQLSNYLLIAFFYVDEHIPIDVKLRFQKISDWIRTQPLQHFSSALYSYHVMLAGSFPRYLFEYLLLVAKRALGDDSIGLADELQNYQHYLTHTDMDVYFSLTPVHPGINMGQLCWEIYIDWTSLVEAHFGKLVKALGRSDTGYEFLHLRTIENFDLIIHPCYQPIIPHANSYLSIAFNPDTGMPNSFSFPLISDFSQQQVIDDFFAKKTLIPLLWAIEYEIKQFGRVTEKHLSLLAHGFKNIYKLLTTHWTLSAVDKQALDFFMNISIANIPLADILSYRIVNLYYQNRITPYAWLQMFKGILNPAPQEKSPAFDAVTQTQPQNTMQITPVPIKQSPADPNGILNWLSAKQSDDLLIYNKIALLKELHNIIAKILNLPLSKNNSTSWNIISRSVAAKRVLDITRLSLIERIIDDKLFLLWFVFLSYCKIDLFTGGDPLVDIFLESKILTLLTTSAQDQKLNTKIFQRMKTAYLDVQEDSAIAAIPQLYLLAQDAIVYIHVAVNTKELPITIALMITSAVTKFYLQMSELDSIDKNTAYKPISYLFYPQLTDPQHKLEYQLKNLCPSI